MTWEYLAGFTDGDGCVTQECAKGKYHYARIRWNQKESDSFVLDEIGRFLISKGVKVTARKFCVSTATHKYPQRELGLTNADDCRKILISMLPYLIVKKRRAAEVLFYMQQVFELKKLYGKKYNYHRFKG